ncbi:adenosine kinase [Exilibacterium tricleocarpae]|uniref:Adenosine kinase n=1 Tax=Exilibacterium tricleocarpae TaxID=2591008 RepID=A0A545T3E6_9GAMM|nr:adenosine kinase [Exilibacterium tricleocarpae]TQV71718.1 adenosine kinase [Exilibacterium tricleocarpae]
MSQYHVYGLGAALVDTEIEVTDADLTGLGVDKGLMTLVDEQRQHEITDYLSGHLVASKRASGGSGANTVIACSYFGANAFYSCKVANDDNGEFYLNDLRAAGVGYHHNGKLDSGITGKCLVMITPDAERTMNTFLGISETVSVNELHEEAIKASQYVYIEGYQVTSDSGREAAIKLRRVAEDNGVKTALSLSDPAMVEFFRDGLQAMIGEGVDLLFCNRDEALGYTQTDSVKAAATALQRVAKTFAITLGAEGAVIYDGERLINIEAHPIKAVDSNGAGDMFAGAFLYAVTQGFDFEKAGQLASYAAAVVVSQFGPRLRPQQHEEVLRHILDK